MALTAQASTADVAHNSGLAGAVPIPATIRVLSLPPYSPEPNAVEHLGDKLREMQSHNRAVDSLDALEDQIVVGLLALQTDHERIKSICAWEWIITVMQLLLPIGITGCSAGWKGAPLMAIDAA